MMNPNIVVPIALYLLVDNTATPDPNVSTRRSEAGGFRSGIYDHMAAIWSQAGVQLDAQTIEFLEAPTTVLEGFCQASHIDDLTPHVQAVANLPLPNPGMINGFYVLNLPVNGISYPDAKIFFVKDEPLLVEAVSRRPITHRVLGARVSSHEIGHILRLRHYEEPECYDLNRLMFSGTTGEHLSSVEIVRARTTAQSLLANP